MKHTKQLKIVMRGFGVLLMGMFLSLAVISCGGGKSSDRAIGATDDEAFYETQPVMSGLYDASYYQLSGNVNKKGPFDGRIYFSLSPDLSALYVFENGNRTKIDYLVKLEHPFEKTDSGVYISVDDKNNPVSIAPDSVNLVLDFLKGSENVKITFSDKPRHTGTAVEILEKITAQKQKK